LLFLSQILQTSDANQWVKLDLGQPALICGIITQGRGKTSARAQGFAFMILGHDTQSAAHFYAHKINCDGIGSKLGPMGDWVYRVNVSHEFQFRHAGHLSFISSELIAD
jgi:hypothetical protein